MEIIGDINDYVKLGADTDSYLDTWIGPSVFDALTDDNAKSIRLRFDKKEMPKISEWFYCEVSVEVKRLLHNEYTWPYIKAIAYAKEHDNILKKLPQDWFNEILKYL